MPYISLDVLNNAPQPILGIDLGTTNSLAAIFQGDRPIVLAPGKSHADGMVPSALWFPEHGPPLVGREARDRAAVDPAHALFSVKRFMGRGLADVRGDLASVPFAAGENEHGVIQFDVRGRTYTPQELSALVLRRVHQNASEALGAPAPTRVVITVPAYFDDAQRQATRDAARLAGLEVVRIVNEPTAASLAYGLDQKKQGNVAVYDLGGGTFDVSILSIEDGVFRVLATHGDTHLGGDDLDRALGQALQAEIHAAFGDEVASDAAFQQALRLACERAKIELSARPEAELSLVAPDSGRHWRRAVRRAELERAIAPWIARSLDGCRRALADAKLSAAQIDEVVLVGGSTRIPAVRRAVEAQFGRKPHAELNPDEVVALGAAVQGHVLAGGTRDILLLDVTPLSLGLETMGGAVAKIIDRNSPIPCQATEGFTTYADQQTGLVLNVVQGERELARDCRSLGRFELKGIPPMPAGMARISVRFQIDADGILAVSAREESSGAAASIDVNPMHGLTDSEVEAMLAQGFEHAREDFENRRLADLLVELGTMIRAAEKGLAEARDELDRETVRDVEEALVAARAAREAKELRSVERARDALERAAMPLASILMDRVAKAAVAGKRLDEI